MLKIAVDGARHIKNDCETKGPTTRKGELQCERAKKGQNVHTFQRQSKSGCKKGKHEKKCFQAPMRFTSSPVVGVVYNASFGGFAGKTRAFQSVTRDICKMRR